MKITITADGKTLIDKSRYCISCDKPLDESKAVLIPGATPEEEAAAEVIVFSRDIPDVGFADSRWWCGDCWRAEQTGIQ